MEFTFLGDNILLDASNGDIIHVDFGYLFNKGEKLEWPEIVPFRLTHNMVHAMGPQGIEGLFRKCSEITMRVIQHQEYTLMTVLRPFVYDTTVNWTKTIKKQQNSSERIDEEAKFNLQRVKGRLQGFVTNDFLGPNLPLSIEGLVSHLIKEATDINRLCCMYWGWGPYY